MLDGWSCSCFSQLHGHLGMFVSPSGSRFRRFSSVMANLGVPPLHHTVLTTGYAVTEHSAATTILLTQLSGHISSSCMRFTPIFQKAPTKFLNPNIGDGKRSSCVGLPAGREAMWCQLRASVAMSISADIDLALASSESLSVLENSILRTDTMYAVPGQKRIQALRKILPWKAFRTIFLPLVVACSSAARSGEPCPPPDLLPFCMSPEHPF